MKVLAIGSAKGGVGKSTSTVYLAARAAEYLDSTDEQPRVAILDRDESKHLTKLYDMREDLHRPGIVLLDGDTLPPSDAGFALTIIDTPPGLSALPSLREAHLVLVPCQPTDMGVNSLVEYLDSIEEQRLIVSPGMRLIALLPTMVNNTRLHRTRLEDIRRIASHQRPQLLVLPPIPYRVAVALPDLEAHEYDAVAKELFGHGEIIETATSIAR
jgi:cellulose biosynthesis protein BcsQ